MHTTLRLIPSTTKKEINKIKKELSWAYWCMPAIPALKRLSGRTE
jgi:hypothetical protein